MIPTHLSIRKTHLPTKLYPKYFLKQINNLEIKHKSFTSKKFTQTSTYYCHVDDVGTRSSSTVV